VGAKLQADLV